MAKSAKTAVTPAATPTATTRLVTGKVRFSYLHAFEPSMMQGETDPSKAKYSVSLLIPKSNKALCAQIKAAIDAATQQGVVSKFGGKVPSKFKNPLRDGDEEKPDDENYTGMYFMSASSKDRPGIVDEELKPILDSTEIYSGCYGRADINFYPFNSFGSTGVACGLNHLQKLADGEPLAGKGSASEAFAPYTEVSDEDPEDADDLM